MHRSIALLGGLLFACIANAGSGTLRVGSQVLVAGDSAARVIELLGKPAYRTHAKPAPAHRGRKRKGGRSSSAGGEQWQYRQGGRIVTIVVADGKVASIRDDGS